MSEAASHLAAKPALCRLVCSELRVVGGLEVFVLGVVSASALIDEACKFRSERWTVWMIHLMQDAD